MTSRLPIRLAHISLRMDPGGIENFIVNFACQLDPDQFSLTVGCLDAGGILLDQIHQLGFKSFVLHRRPGLDWGLIFTLARIFSREKFDIVHTHNEAAHFYAGLGAKLAGVPCLITTEHSRHYIDEQHLKRRLQKCFMAWITDRWITVSEELARLSAERDNISAKKILAIPNGIDISRFSPPRHTEHFAALKQEIGVPENAKLAIMVARLHPIKNHAMLIHAVPQIMDTVENFHVLFAGDGEMREDLEILAQQFGIHDRIHFLGYRKDTHKLLWLSDIFILCSETEGMPLSLLEAMAAEVPVVITRSANRAELIMDGMNGYVAENDAASLAAVVIKSLSDPAISHVITERGTDFVKEHFSIETMCICYKKVYEEILRR